MNIYTTEIIDAHIAIEAWLGRGEGDCAALMARFSDAFTMITPGGATLDKPALVNFFQAQRAARTGLSIRVDDVELLAEWESGAVLRYRLSMQSPHRPSAYLRTTSTIGSLNETALALGLSARPLARIPIVAAVEGRVVDQAGDRRVQPAVMAVTELPALALPGALQAALYAQGGYVGGRYATPFADGQLRVDRSVLTHGRAEARLGAGAWGGIQEGASRLDAGPGLTLSAPISSKVFGRLAVDWRFRVAGDAEPGSGPAMTVAAGF